ncbi:uncharacterized protein LOC135808189 isoform X2 [Sycon ciliatum]|uniref:uncharacterized protein LOC135808189 isoform X2 n=1 Tax=Sycon ciliatum TaxID=27933 RepID=UPI0031F6540F
MPAQVMIVVAKHNYQKAGENILKFKRGDLLEVLEETNAKWWAARMVNDADLAGYIPSSYVQAAHPDSITGSTTQPKVSSSASGSFRQRFLVFENSSAPSYSPQAPRADWCREERSRSPSPLSTENQDSDTMSTINPVGALTKELRFEQKRGIQLGRPELQKVFDGGRNAGGHMSPKAGKRSKQQDSQIDTSSELGKMLAKQTQKIASHEREEEEEVNKPEFLRLKLKKAEASS